MPRMPRKKLEKSETQPKPERFEVIGDIRCCREGCKQSAKFNAALNGLKMLLAFELPKGWKTVHWYLYQGLPMDTKATETGISAYCPAHSPERIEILPATVKL